MIETHITCSLEKFENEYQKSPIQEDKKTYLTLDIKSNLATLSDGKNTVCIKFTNEYEHYIKAHILNVLSCDNEALSVVVVTDMQDYSLIQRAYMK